jgi:hypothetical protein
VRFSAERARVCAVLVASTLRDVGFLVSKKEHFLGKVGPCST